MSNLRPNTNQSHEYRAWLLAFSAGAILVSVAHATSAQTPTCPTEPPTTITRTIPAPNRNDDPIILNLQPCQTVRVSIQASASTRSTGDGNIYFRIRNSSQAILAETSMLCSISCSGVVPQTTSTAGYPLPGTRGTAGLAYDLQVSTGSFNFFGGPTATYTVEITKTPRQGYNLGGDSFANATQIPHGEEQKGSLHWREVGQFYRTHLEPNQILYLTGEATAHPTVGTAFSIILYSPSQTELKTLVNQYIEGTKSLTSSFFQNNTGVAGDYYLKARAGSNPAWDFKFTTVTPTLTLTPASITRGDTATFTVNGAAGGTFSSWQYEVTDPAAASTITRSVDVNNPSWEGTLVASGTGRVTVTLGGFSQLLEKMALVSPRNWQPFPPKPATRRYSGYTPPCGGQLTFTDPSTGGAGIGATRFCLNYFIDGPEMAAVGNGPNQGVKWIVDAHDTSTVDWGMHDDADNLNSTFSLANCGNFVAAPGSSCNNKQGQGFIAAADFRAQIERHEVGPSNSHYAKYVSEWSRADRNPRVLAEPLIAPPSTTLGAFALDVGNTLSNGVNKVAVEMSAYEPCGAQCDASCSLFLGWVNIAPYEACLVPSPFRLFSVKAGVR